MRKPPTIRGDGGTRATPEEIRALRDYLAATVSAMLLHIKDIVDYTEPHLVIRNNSERCQFDNFESDVKMAFEIFLLDWLSSRADREEACEEETAT
jgi:hypothetical protein